MRSTLAVAVAVTVPAFAALAEAQQPIGATYRVTPSVASRGALQGAAGTLFSVFDRSDYVGWGMTGAPGTRVLRGVTVQSRDFNGATPESWSLSVYSESLTAPGLPDVASPVATFPPITNPVRPAGTADFTTSTTFATPVTVSAARDVFIGITLSAQLGWSPATTEGHAPCAVLGGQTRWSEYDEPGFAPIQGNNYTGLISAGAPILNPFSPPRQLLIDILCDAPGGACTAITNQTSYPISNTAPGTGSYLSGLHPDARSPSRNTGRADDVGFAFLDASLPDNTPVVFLADFFAFGPELPLAAVVPGSVGVLCLNQATAATLNVRFLQAGQAFETITIPAAIRPNIAGIPLVWQAIALHVQVNALRGSPCGRQVF